MVDMIIAYEEGTLDDEQVLDLFSNLVGSGLAWTLQGHYGRTAASLIDGGWLANDGSILRRFEEV